MSRIYHNLGATHTLRIRNRSHSFATFCRIISRCAGSLDRKSEAVCRLILLFLIFCHISMLTVYRIINVVSCGWCWLIRFDVLFFGAYTCGATMEHFRSLDSDFLLRSPFGYSSISDKYLQIHNRVNVTQINL